MSDPLHPGLSPGPTAVRLRRLARDLSRAGVVHAGHVTPVLAELEQLAGRVEYVEAACLRLVEAVGKLDGLRRLDPLPAPPPT
jgi:hypothetical protein